MAGGAELFVVKLLRQLKQRGLSVGVLSLSSKTDSVGLQMRQLLENSEIPYFVGPTERVHAMSAFWYTMMLRRIKPNIVHMHTVNTELAHYIGTKFYRHQHRIVRTIHSIRAHPNRWYRRAFKKNHANISIACSASVKKQYERDIKHNLITIQNGVDFDWPIKTKRLKDQYLIKLNLDKESCHVINIGRQAGVALEIAPKAHDVLIKAWLHGELGRKKNLLHLIGDGNLSDELKRLASCDPSIIFHGIQNNIHEWLLAADIFVMPSRYEGLPIAGIEALGTGLPSIFSDIQPLKELKTSYTKWVGVDDVRALSMELINATGTNRPIKQSEIQQIRNRFGMNKTADQYNECYNSIKGQKNY